ncbi:hypothetical protein GQ44DRAFT_704617 [Phaeosphaeriaceae sp. PMI808]|nr:hypothetical protein GQ44DRAFT_704617 [Phaeosphaeriaceae sp. PMI808]
MGSPARVTQDESSDTCVICLAPVTERAIAVPCNHYNFDFVCLVSWLQERPTCPLCKVEITTVQYDWRSPTDFTSYMIQRSHPPAKELNSLTNQSSSLFGPHRPPGIQRGTWRPYSPPIEDAALRRRRTVYQRKLYSMHVGSNQFSRYCDVTPQMFGNSVGLQSRARAWIRRELRVFTFLHSNAAGPSTNTVTTSSNSEFLISYIISILKMVDTKASNGHAENLLAEFLGRGNSQLFLHELQAWLRSPYSKLEEWDQEVQYSEDVE